MFQKTRIATAALTLRSKIITSPFLPTLKERKSSLTTLLVFMKPRLGKLNTSINDGGSIFIIFWDEWVVLDRLMKHTEENMRIKLALDEKYGNDKNARKPRASSKASNGARGRKRKNDSVIKEKSGVLPDKLVNILIPLTLKKQLVDDFEFITHLGKLVKLPRTPNVNDIFKKYFDYRLKKSGSISDSAEEIMKGLCCYFDKALPVMLLYNNEREQYQEACPNNTVPSSIYGAEHLLRLFVKLPELLIHANIEGDTLIELQTQILDFLRFLRKSQRSFFLSSYHVPEDIENNINKQLFCIAHNIT
ncbi:protein MRG2 isoform X2 [Cicer arietinum]|uniref:Protein MRG2 isoform X2 n=1 Tax=Cicer arietinum TaxID=3827 RepID=A0A3Q7YF99_CICAR|nr:protein MRG2 isoform X2 [Cicer arietinum]